jgi:large subunit ribosomal protein L28
MAQVCELTGRRPAYGNRVSHSNIKTRVRWMPNLRNKSYEIPELRRTLNLMLSTRAIRTIDKLGGITQALFAAKEKELSERLQRIRAQIHATRVKRTAAGRTAEAKQARAAAPKHARAEKASGTPKTKSAKAKSKK